MGPAKKDKRGLGSASEETRLRVARMGGAAFHKKRGAKGADKPDPNVAAQA